VSIRIDRDYAAQLALAEGVTVDEYARTRGWVLVDPAESIEHIPDCACSSFWPWLGRGLLYVGALVVASFVLGLVCGVAAYGYEIGSGGEP